MASARQRGTTSRRHGIEAHGTQGIDFLRHLHRGSSKRRPAPNSTRRRRSRHERNQLAEVRNHHELSDECRRRSDRAANAEEADDDADEQVGRASTSSASAPSPGAASGAGASRPTVARRWPSGGRRAFPSARSRTPRPMNRDCSRSRADASEHRGACPGRACPAPRAPEAPTRRAASGLPALDDAVRPPSGSSRFQEFRQKDDPRAVDAIEPREVDVDRLTPSSRVWTSATAAATVLACSQVEGADRHEPCPFPVDSPRRSPSSFASSRV